MEHHKFLTIKIVFFVVVCAFFAYIIFFTNIIWNHSCVGITYKEISNLAGTELIVRYFDSEYQAKRFYQKKGLNDYCIAALDADNALGIKNTKEWFLTLDFPLVDYNAKYITCTAAEEFVRIHELLLYQVKLDPDDGVIHREDYDDTCELYEFGDWLPEISQNCTKEESGFYIAHRMNSSLIQSAVKRYRISKEANDEFSMQFWLDQLRETCESYSMADMPATARPEIDWIELGAEYSDKLAKIKQIVGETGWIAEDGLDYLLTLSMSYHTSVISLNIKLQDVPLIEAVEYDSEEYTNETITDSCQIQLDEAPLDYDTNPEKYETYLFEELEYGQNVVLTPDTRVTQFRFFRLNSEKHIRNNVYEIEEVLYSCDELTAARPFVVRIHIVGPGGPYHGISYVDDRGNTKRFVIFESGEDGSLYLSEF